MAGVGLGWWWAGDASAPAAADSAGAPDGGEREILYWYDPMVPDQHFDKPGKSPFMDMQLVPKYVDEASGAGISIAPGVRQNLGVRTVQVERGRLPGSISVPGTIGWDLRLEEVVSARVDAIIDRVFVKAPYQRVQAGQPLASILAPAWSTALAEAQALRNSDSAAAQTLQSAAQERLRVLGVPAGASTGNGRIALSAPVDGVVTEIATREGATASAGTLLFRINGTGTVWLEAAIPQAGVGEIVPGTPVEATVSTLPGQVFEGHVETLLPQIEAGSRTQQARIVLENPSGLLTPGMFAQVTLDPTGGEAHPLVPADAVIGGGDQTRVIMMTPEGRFQPVAVQTGRSGGGFTEILSGLDGGERVVASGQFLIDSEASLSGALDRLNAGGPERDAPPMQGMETSTPRPDAKGEREVLYWYDPMRPEVHFDKPGKSPFMDMQLVPKYAGEATAEDVEPAP
ncbi:efflux RND transporter periplasmic adaptor subunit [Luteimonas soli]|uniref:Efflux RND transporter periplasmic adaptor subunit n=1 Tax=Luteimonas soli TaxID=1648966 RepID=A0ABV7XHD9_9GAMM